MERKKREDGGIKRVDVNTQRLQKALELWGGNIYDLSEELGKGRTTLKNIANGRHQHPSAAFIKMVCDRIHADYDWIVEPETPSPTPLEVLEAQTEAPKDDRNEAILSELVKLNEVATEVKNILEALTSQTVAYQESSANASIRIYKQTEAIYNQLKYNR